MVSPAPTDDDSTPEVAGATVPQDSSPEPAASAGDSQLAPSATPADDTLTVTGALTITSSDTDPQAEASTDLAAPGSGAETGWAPLEAELDALIARRESGELSPSEFLDAYRDIGCVGSGEFSEFAPGLAVEILDEGGAVIASGALRLGSSATPDAPSGCRLPFTIVDVPPSAVYTIAVGGATLSYTREQLASRGWNIELEIAAQG